jgi:hypothetical protein
MSFETLVVPRAGFDIENPWDRPTVCTPVALRRATDGALPRLSTEVAGFFDETNLTILFTTRDDHIQATLDEHDAPLYEQDVVEIFLAPRSPQLYFEIEVSPRGTIFDARIDSPDGERETMRVDRDWNCAGLMAALRTLVEQDGTLTIDVLVRIPFESLDAPTPRPGDAWRANFFRIDRHPALGDEFSAWQPTHRRPANFHVPAAFGSLRFEG